ncbi:MAG: CinA family protein [Candidatus Omnitrophica bacterium]|nr:CinA family protein [Candidatus Omnitrophota bacterium]
MPIEQKIAKILIKNKKTLSLAESCTGGLLSNRLTNISGSSKFLKTGIVAYSNEAKIKFLKVPSGLIKTYGAVSSQVAIKMANGARQALNADYGIGITGIAGPTGGTKNKPVGLVFIAGSSKKQDICIQCQFKGSRLAIKSKICKKALELLFVLLYE